MITVGIGEYAVSQDYNETIITHALGSCVAFVVRCPVTRKTALAHIVLPEIERNEQYKYLQLRPGYFADVIIPKIFDEFTKNNLCKINQLQITVAGGADAKNPDDVFKVGAKNVEKVKEYLKLHGVKPIQLDVGGMISRTVEVFVVDGHVQIRKQNMLI